MVEKITSMQLKSENFGDNVKTVLSWVVIARIIIAHLYTVTYLANFYSILTWCRPKILLPWLIVSGFKNFLLEFIVIMVCLLLYWEREFTFAWIAAFIVCKAVHLVPAVYYWRTINTFFVELSEIQQRKLTRANIISNADGNGTRSFDIAKRLRLRTTFAGDLAYKQLRFMSLGNLDELSVISSFDIGGEKRDSKLFRSLATLITVDSREFEETEDDSRLKIDEDAFLSPAEKSMKMLGLNRNDVNDARVKLGKKVLTSSSVEEIEEIVSTVEPKDIEAIGERTTGLDIISSAKTNATMVTEQIAEPNPTSSHVLKDQPLSQALLELQIEIHPSSSNVLSDQPSTQVLSKLPAKSHLSGCTCGKARKEAVDTKLLDSRRGKKRSLDDNFREATTNGYEEDDEESNNDDNFAELYQPPLKKRLKRESKVMMANEKLLSTDMQPTKFYQRDTNFDSNSKEVEMMVPLLQMTQKRPIVESFIIPGFEEESIGWLKSSLAYPKDPMWMKVELFRVEGICLEEDKERDDDSEAAENDMEDSKSNNIQAEPSLFRLNDNIPGVYVQTDFTNDAEQRSNQQVAKDESSSGSTKASTSTQTNISDCWKKKHIESTLKPAIDQDQDSLKLKPLISKAALFKNMKKFSNAKKLMETIKERETREMKALKIYNHQTLFKYKREMEVKKRNPAIGSRLELQSIIFSCNPTNLVGKDIRGVPKAPQQGRVSNANGQVRLDQIPKRQARSRPQQQTSKLSTFNLGLDELEYSISVSFSSENKNRSRLQDKRNNEVASTSQEGRKQLSKYSKPMKMRDEQTTSPTMMFEGLQKGRDLQRTQGIENITGRNVIENISYHTDSYGMVTWQNRIRTSGTILTSTNDLEHSNFNIAEVEEGIAFQDKHNVSQLKEAMKNINWSFTDYQITNDHDELPQDIFLWSREDVLYDIIDDTDIISLLQSAFASNPGNTERGFYLGPGSTELYSVSNYLDGVVEEIMKTARLQPNPDAFINESTTEVDYGESYLQKFEVTQLLVSKDSDEESDSDGDASDNIEIQDIAPTGSVELNCLVPIETCWSSYSGEGFDSRKYQQLPIEETDVADKKNRNDHIDIKEYRQGLATSSQHRSKGIANLLGEQELSHLEFWTNELKDLASYDRHGEEFMKQFRHLIEMPGYCVVKTLVDFFREFVAVSRSTMTSRMFHNINRVSTPNSLRSEEIISGGFNEDLNIPVVNDALVDHENVALIEVIDDDVSDSLRTLIDRLTEGAENNDQRNERIVGIHDDRTTFPLREDQFYFGTPENTRRFIKEGMFSGSTSKFEAQNHEIQLFHITNSEPPRASASNSKVFAINNTSPEVRNDEAESSTMAQGPFASDLTVDSFDSFYSNDAAGISQRSDNVISIGGESPFEDFIENPLDSISSIEQDFRPIRENSHSENQ